MTKLTTKTIALTFAIVGMSLPAQAMAQSSSVSYAPSTQIWDIQAPKADRKTFISHMDVQPGQGFDQYSRVAPKAAPIVRRSQIKGSVQASEMWDVMSAPRTAQPRTVSHMDIQPGQSFDYAPPKVRVATRTQGYTNAVRTAP